MLTTTIERLEYLVDTLPDKMMQMAEKTFSYKVSPEKWSKKEIVGHLIDSAANNHQRFVRVQFEDIPAIRYDQNNWNFYSYYQDMDSKHVVHTWEMYNRHLLELIKRIPESLLSRLCQTEQKVTLHWLIEDYIVHMEHHLHQVIDY